MPTSSVRTRSERACSTPGPRAASSAPSTAARTGSRSQSNLPHAPVYWIVVQEHFSDLVVATYGRGIWILDDITPVRQYAAELTAKDVAFMPPRAAYRFRGVE